MRSKRWTQCLMAAGLVTTVWLLPGKPSLGQVASGDARFKAAVAQLWDGDFPGAVGNLESISRDFPNSQLDAAAQLELAFVYSQVLVDPPKARQLNSQVATRFPDLLEGYVAATNLLNIGLLVDGRPFAEYLSGLNGLVDRAGGGSLAGIRSGRRLPSRALANLPIETQRHILGGLYVEAAGRLARRPSPEAGPQLTQEAINVWTYARDAYPELYGGEVTRAIRQEIVLQSGQTGASTDSTRPSITKIKPERRVGPRSDVVVKLNDGDFTQSQVDLSSLSLLVDGIEVKSAVSVFTKTARKAKPGKAFMKTKLRYKAPQAFSAGSHTVLIKVSDLAGNATEKSWSFTVKSGDKDDRDDESGDDRCDGEPSDSDD